MSLPDGPGDPYVKKVVTLNVARRRLGFETSQQLFSSHAVDRGTRLLLSSLAKQPAEAASILDLGCGYGPLGVGAQAIHAGSTVHLVDRDALAVRFAARNALAAVLGGTTAAGSLGFDDVLGQFDLIVSNVPGKAPPPVLEHVLVDAGAHLAPGGEVAIVAVTPLEPTVDDILDRAGAEVFEATGTNDYVVRRYRLPPAGGVRGSGFDRGIYDRERPAFDCAGVRYSICTVHGVSEFDSLGFHTELVVDIVATMPKGVDHLVVVNPGQGHGAVVAARLLEPERITIVDRDLLALRATRRALAENTPGPQVTLRHEVDPIADIEPADLVIATLPDKEPLLALAGTVRGAVAATRPGGQVVLAGTSTTVTRAADALKGTPTSVRNRQRHRGFSAAVLAVG